MGSSGKSVKMGNTFPYKYNPTKPIPKIRERKAYPFDREWYEAVRERIAQYAYNVNGSENNC